ncbi:SMI1/KNR4 family protein [Streptomyces sp. PKU-EA00015]|uniref:SMI1/KNR4 family protein n=1 Tax=Streptomyces sp. PKU-EA00015 TaxID=2748326 RepID=UPI0015A27D29|nr:SMI1/KNR4 family protein [Streptomyces sp. PKU-EA00015]NWF29455.1 SMI1/KNR4 family protein [Streptomyces sp. PKU-EA00015]
MTPAFDVAAALGGGVAGREHAWRFVRDFAAAWTGQPLRDGDGTPEDELAAAEGGLELVLPRALREGYALLGRRSDLTTGQDPLVPPGGLYADDGPEGGVLVFRRENQDCASWGIPMDRIADDDPPVVVESADGWIPYLDRMSTAWVELVLTETLLASAHRYDACELPDDLLPVLEAEYRRVDLPDHPLWTGADESPLRWYAAPGRVLRRDGLANHSWVHAGGQTAAHLGLIRAQLPGPWVC